MLMLAREESTEDVAAPIRSQRATFQPGFPSYQVELSLEDVYFLFRRTENLAGLQDRISTPLL